MPVTITPPASPVSAIRAPQVGAPTAAGILGGRVYHNIQVVPGLKVEPSKGLAIIWTASKRCQLSNLQCK